MAQLITIPDLRTHIYDGQMQEITRADSTIAQEAIDAAIAEAKGFLSRYDLLKLFGSTDADAAVNDPNLKRKVKDIVLWNLVQLANPNINLETAQSSYQMAIDNYFKPIMAGKLQPEGWPYKDVTTEAPAPPGDEVRWNSNPKRHNHY